MKRQEKIIKIHANKLAKKLKDENNKQSLEEKLEKIKKEHVYIE